MIEKPSGGQGLPSGPSGGAAPQWAGWQRMNVEAGDLVEAKGSFLDSKWG